MNLAKLFETQKVLRERINYNEPDRFNKLVLALMVELGACANEQRTWKFWSNDQDPRIKVREGNCNECNGTGDMYIIILLLYLGRTVKSVMVKALFIKINSLKNTWTNCILFWKLGWESE